MVLPFRGGGCTRAIISLLVLTSRTTANNTNITTPGVTHFCVVRTPGPGGCACMHVAIHVSSSRVQMYVGLCHRRVTSRAATKNIAGRFTSGDHRQDTGKPFGAAARARGRGCVFRSARCRDTGKSNPIASSYHIARQEAEVL